MEKLKFYLGLPCSARQRSLFRTRPPMDKSAFISSVIECGGDEDAAGFVWESLAQWILFDGFTPNPEDSLYRVFGIAGEEVDDDIVLNYLDTSGLSVQVAQRLAPDSVDSALEICQFISRVRSFEFPSGHELQP